MSQLSKPDLLTLMNLKLPDNTAQDITPQDLRDVLESMIESDNNPNDIGTEVFTSTDQTELENLVLALLLLTNFPAYAELFRGTDSGQSLPLAGAALTFDTEGFDKVLEYESASEIKIISNIGTEQFNVNFQGTVTIANATSMTVHVRVNAVNVRQLGTLMPSNNAVDGFAMGAFMEFADGDLVEIFVTPDSDNKDFDMKIGARFTITRI